MLQGEGFGSPFAMRSVIMSMQEYLGWAQSLIATYGLDVYIKALFVIVLAATVILRFTGRKE